MFLIGNIACSSWLGWAHSHGLSGFVPEVTWKATVAVCFAVSEVQIIPTQHSSNVPLQMIILYAVSDQVPGRQVAGPCIVILQALWVALGIWQWSSGAVYSFVKEPL